MPDNPASVIGTLVITSFLCCMLDGKRGRHDFVGSVVETRLAPFTLECKATLPGREGKGELGVHEFRVVYPSDELGNKADLQ